MICREEINMRVLEVMGSLHRGGAETMIMNYYRAFDKKICQMDFIIHSEFENDYREEAEKMGARILLMDRPGKIGAREYIKSLTVTIKKNGPYDAIHIHTNYQAFLAIIAANKAGIKKIVVHSHTTSFKKHEIFVNRVVMKLYHTVNIACGVAAGDAFFGKNNYMVLNNAIDVSRFKNVDNETIQKTKREKYQERKLIGHLGSFTSPKNHGFIIECAEELQKYRKDFKILLFGEGEKKEEIQNAILTRGLTDIVELCGVTENPANTYRLFDVFILPSLYEGFPVTLVEAQLSGVYCLASANISKECDLQIGRLEYLELDRIMWANRIDQLLEKIKKYDGEIVIEQFDVNIQWRKLYDIYSV